MPNTPPCPYWIERFAIRNVLTLHPECWIKCARDLATRHGLGAIVVHSFCGDYRRQKVGFLAVAANPWLPECFSDYDADVELVIGTPSRRLLRILSLRVLRIAPSSTGQLELTRDKVLT